MISGLSQAHYSLIINQFSILICSETRQYPTLQGEKNKRSSLRRRVVMRVVTSLIFVSAFALAIQAQAPAPPAADNAPAGNADNGKKLYAQYGCYQCHGYAAQGGVGPRLAPRPLAFAAFSKYVRQPSGEMPPYTLKVISDSQLADVYAFLRSVPPPPPVDSIPLLKEN